MTKHEEIARCDREIAEIEALLRSGHTDIAGLVRALVDWNCEKRVLQGEIYDALSA